MPSANSQVKIIKVPHKLTETRLMISLPKGVAEYLGLTDKKTTLFAVPVEGVLQLSTQAPTITIPVARLTEDSFVMQ